jgi:type II secretion system protein C
MSDFAKTLGKFAATPWKAGLVVLGVSFLVATVSSVVVANFFFPADGRLPTTARPASTFNVPNPTSTLNQASIDMIIKRNLFNSEGTIDDTKKEVDVGPQTAEAVKSDLPVKLVGTIYGGDPFSGIALVENNSKRTINSFMVGDSLIKEAVVKEIHKEKVIIDRNGRLEYIEVVREALTRNKRNKKRAPASAGSNSVAPIATEPPPSTFKEDGFERKEREISMTQAYRNKLLTTDFTKVLQDVKATPNMVDGELKGFVLTRIRKDSIYEKAGFQNDDIVEEVNGVPLTDTAQAIRLLQSLRNEAEIEVRVNRGGSPTKFTLNVR